MNPQAGDNVLVSKWVTQDSLLLTHVGYSTAAFKLLDSSRKFAGWGGNEDHIIGDKANREFADFLAEAFVRKVCAGQEGYYRITASIAEWLLHSDIINGLLYPTIAMKANSDNFAIKTEYFDKSIQFDHAEFDRIDGVENGQYNITILDTASEVNTGGNILWKGRLGKWELKNKGDSLTFQSEYGEWVARNDRGEIIKPE
jgi:hypothetical protein